MQNDNYGTFINSYTSYTHGKGMEARIGRSTAVKAFQNLAGKTVLDFGCGPATNARDLRAWGANQTIGIDIDEAELSVAREIDPEGIYIHYAGLNLAEIVGAFQIDAILASFSFCAINNQILPLILKDMRGLLAQGGELVVIDPNFERSLGVHYPGELHYHAKTDVKCGDYMHVTLGEGEGAIELYHDIYREHADYQLLLNEGGFSIDFLEEIRPDESCVEAWAELARKYPPFLLIKAH